MVERSRVFYNPESFVLGKIASRRLTLSAIAAIVWLSGTSLSPASGESRPTFGTSVECSQVRSVSSSQVAPDPLAGLLAQQQGTTDGATSPQTNTDSAAPVAPSPWWLIVMPAIPIVGGALIYGKRWWLTPPTDGDSSDPPADP